ncbi:VOC family protein [candidate division KSB1 bacterium]|nr:VOC family protein [bacterium]NUM67403.1 VOC family protein [candidate division KSB1 bacterium]
MIKRIDHTTITVRNLARSIDFYTHLLGFTIDHEMWFPESRLRIVFLRLGDTILELFGVPEIRGEALSHVNEVLGYKHICLLVESVDEEHQRLAQAGVPFRIPPTTVQETVRIAFFSDPDGMDIELIEYLP